ncbi:MAG: hypothetical protein HDQ87_06395 [Clostridia bacterium]|nr:hypothetical protein [Clostridia bacterium]
MGRKDAAPKRSVQIPFRLTPEEAERLNRAAGRSGLTREGYIRRKLFKGPPLARDVSGALFQLTCEVNRIGDAVTAAVRSGQADDSVSEDQADALLDALGSVQSSLQDLRKEVLKG